jgi:hypothetical protein
MANMKSENSPQMPSEKSNSIDLTKQQLPPLSEDQLKTMVILQTLWLAKVMFYFLLVAFGVIAIALFICVFWLEKDIKTTSVFFILEGVIVWSLKHLVRYLFPTNNDGLFRQFAQKILTNNNTGKSQ